MTDFNQESIIIQTSVSFLNLKNNRRILLKIKKRGGEMIAREGKNKVEEKKDKVPFRAIEAVVKESPYPIGVMNWEETPSWSNDGNPGHNYSH